MSVTGYDTEDRFYATKYSQGGRKVFAIDLSLTQIASYLPEPDPNHPTEGNRRVREAHAIAFGNYVREHEEWVSPALLLRGPDIFKFEVKEEIAGTQFGIVSLPRLARSDLRILDGQHRILGIHRAIQGIARELEKQRDLLARAKRNGEAPEVLKELSAQIKRLELQRARLDRERISIQIMVEDDSSAYKQMFFDIADNALGITSSVRARFDSRKVVNRALEDVMKHSLLAGRVDMEQDRIGANSPNLLGAKHVADAVRSIAVGVDGRVGRRLEDELREDALVQQTNAFLDALVDGFPVLGRVADGGVTPEELRRGSLLGSTSMLRVLAGVYHDLTATEWEDEEIADFYARLNPHMDAPVRPDGPWVMEVPNEIFSEGASAPKARRQDLRVLNDTIVGWALTQPAWLAASAAA
jgi:DNA-sulfur modification-associated